MSDRFAIPICRHLKTNGLRCQSPALNREAFCYFHLRLHKEHHRPLTAREIVERRNLQYSEYEEAVLKGGEDPIMIARAYPIQNEFHFPPLEDAESIQVATSMLFHALAQGQIHLSRARLLRDLLRVATVSCRLNKPDPDAATAAVRQIEHTPEGLAIAPADAPSDDANPAPVEAGTPEEATPGPVQRGIVEPPQQTAEELEHSIGRDFSPGIRQTGSKGALAPETCFSETHQSCHSELPQPASPELTWNQDSTCNPFCNNILADPSGVSLAI